MPLINRKRRVRDGDDVEDENADVYSNDNIGRSSTQQKNRRATNELVNDEDVDEGEEDEGSSSDRTTREQMVKNLIRMALASEHSRTPIRRSDVVTKVMPPGTSRQFQQVLSEANNQLREVFGMELTLLPQRERITIAQKRAAVQSQGQNSNLSATARSQHPQNQTSQTQQDPSQTQPSIPASTTSQAYILTTTLPAPYRSAAIIPPSHAPSQAIEAAYIGLVSFIVGLVYLSPGASLAESRLEKQLKRMNADEYVFDGERTDTILKRMLREGYLVKVKDANGGGAGGGGEETVDYVVGPRGKIEIGEAGVAGLVRAVYRGASEQVSSGMSDTELNDLERRLTRTLGENIGKTKVNLSTAADEGEAEASEEAEQTDGRRSQRHHNPKQEDSAVDKGTEADSSRRRSQATYKGTAANGASASRSRRS